VEVQLALPVNLIPPAVDERLENLQQHQEMMSRILQLEQDHLNSLAELGQMAERVTIAERASVRWRSQALAADVRARRHEDEIRSLKLKVEEMMRYLDKGDESSTGEN